MSSLDAYVQRLERLVADSERRLQWMLQTLQQARRRQQREQQQNAQRQVAYENAIQTWVKKTEKKACVVKISELCRPCEEDCMVCLEKHPKEAMVVLGCKHELGRECFLRTVTHNISRGVRCPLCRTPVKAFHGYRRRAAPQPRPPAAEN